MISGIIIMLGAVHAAKPAAAAHAASGFTKVVVSDDEDPIIVRGHVKNQIGLPIMGASIKLKKNGAVAYQATTNSLGAYHMSGVQAGSYVMYIGATGYQTKVVSLNITSEVVRVDTLSLE